MELPEDFEIPPSQIEFFETVTCSVCSCLPLEKIKKACLVDHKEMTCATCLRKQFRAGQPNYKKCPVCRNDLVRPSERQVDIMREVVRSNISVPCTNRWRIPETNAWTGCERMEKLSKMLTHMAECRFADVDCPFKEEGCSKTMKKDIVNEHVKECDYRPLSCRYHINGCPRIDDLACETLNHESSCIWNGILSPSALGTMGIPEASNKLRIKMRGVQCRRVRVRGVFLTITVNGSEYCDLVNYLTMENARQTPQGEDEEEAVICLRRAAAEAGIWLSGPTPEAAQEEDGEMNPLLIDQLLRDSDGEVESAGQDMQEDQDETDVAALDGDQAMEEADEPGGDPVVEPHVATDRESAGTEVGDAGEVAAPQTDSEDIVATAGAAGETEMDVEETREAAGPQWTTQDQPLPMPSQVLEDVQDNLLSEAAGGIEPVPAAEQETRITKIEDIVDQITFKSFLSSLGDHYGECDTAEQERRFQEQDPRAWVEEERQRLRAIKDRPAGNNTVCLICNETTTAIWPNGQPEGEISRHRHYSTRLESLRSASATAEAGCGACVEPVHVVRKDFRRRLILTSSSLYNCFTEGKPLFPEYRGLKGHIDVTSIPGGKIQHLVHALLVEIKQSNEPIDCVLYGGLNDVMEQEVYTEGGLHFVDQAKMITVYRSLAILSQELANSPLRHTLRCCLIKCPPAVTHKGPGFERAWKELNLALN